MQLLDLSLPDPASNLAVDEALLDSLESGAYGSCEVLRLWAFNSPVVVVGRASKIADEVNREFCDSAQIPILRRCSGGTAVTAGHGCLLYSLILNTELRPDLKQIDGAHRFVMETIRDAIVPLVAGVQFQGTCDLTWHNRKFSGNSLRVARRHLLYHGTVLFDYPLDLIHRTLGTAPRQPDYRDGRHHEDFIINLPTTEFDLRTALASAFEAGEPMPHWPRERTDQLVASRYGLSDWHFRH